MTESSRRIICIEYVVLNADNKHIVSCWRSDNGFLIGDFKNVNDMKAYSKRLYNQNKVVFKRTYEKEGKEIG